MRYLLLLYGDADGEAALGPDERREIVDAHRALIAELRGRGVLIEAEALAGADEMRVVQRGRGRKTYVTDGPFAETKEQLGSFYLVECRDTEEALRIAEEIPESPGLVVEVWPVAG
jgi:hypothetical protein